MLQCALNNYEFMVHYVPIYRKRPKNFNEGKNLEYFSLYNLFDAYETKVNMKELLISYFLYQRLHLNSKCFQYIMNLYYIYSLVFSFFLIFKIYEKCLFIQTLQFYKSL